MTRPSRFVFPAMGSECALHLPDADLAVAQAAEAEVLRIEYRYSRYRPDSVLARIGSRTLFTAILLGEISLGAGMLVGAAYFQRQGMLLVAVVLLVKAIGFLGVAVMSTHDLIPRFGTAEP